MPRRTIALLITLALAILVAPLAADAQPVGKVYRIGLLTSGPASPASMLSLEAFRQSLRDWVTSKARTSSSSSTGQRAVKHVPASWWLSCSSSRSTCLWPEAPPAIRAAQQATRTIPIVMAGGGDPVAAGWIASLAQPGGNITGLSTQSAELSGKQLEILKETVPMLSRIAVLANPAEPDSRSPLHYAQGAARALQVSLHVLAVQSREDLANAFAAIQRGGIGAFLYLARSRWVNERVRQAAVHEAGVVFEVGPGETVDAIVTRCLQRLWPGEASW